MSPHVEPTNLERFPLQAHFEELRRRREAVGSLQGGSTYFEEDLQIFIQYAKEQGILLQLRPPELTTPPSDEENEHQVWFVETRGTFLKATWPGFFGLKVVHRPDEDSRASPIDYLERWLLHNEFFGDKVRFLGAIATENGLRFLIEQPAISGIPATENQIHGFFTGNGWLPFIADGETAFFDPVHQLAISDTHRGNIILMDDGLLAHRSPCPATVWHTSRCHLPSRHQRLSLI
jgi:hypothetical protein